jgi:uracil-DNA glycosylase
VKVRDALRRALAGWEDDLPATWRSVIGGTKLNFESRAFDATVHSGEIIIPRRRGKRVAGSPPEAHIFHALEKISPKDVRAVILGQEPYSNPAWATGRAFEQGNLKDWPENNRLIAASLRRIVQNLASARSRNNSYASGDPGWKTLVRDVQSGTLDLHVPRELFDHLQNAGVLLLNTSLTVSVDIRAGRPKRCRSHFRLWEPLIYKLLSFLATRKAGHLVFLLWGQHALDIFERGGIRAAAESAGIWHRKVDAVRHPHPAAITRQGAVFLHPPNPFLRANEALKRMGAKPIAW